jgi:hypothetical protein
MAKLYARRNEKFVAPNDNHNTVRTLFRPMEEAMSEHSNTDRTISTFCTLHGWRCICEPAWVRCPFGRTSRQYLAFALCVY